MSESIFYCESLICFWRYFCSDDLYAFSLADIFYYPRAKSIYSLVPDYYPIGSRTLFPWSSAYYIQCYSCLASRTTHPRRIYVFHQPCRSLYCSTYRAPSQSYILACSDRWCDGICTISRACYCFYSCVFDGIGESRGKHLGDRMSDRSLCAFPTARMKCDGSSCDEPYSQSLFSLYIDRDTCWSCSRRSSRSYPRYSTRIYPPYILH